METVDSDAVETLRRRHAQLEAMLRVEYGRPKPDDLTLKRLKLEKLHIKEELDRLRIH